MDLVSKHLESNMELFSRSRQSFWRKRPLFGHQPCLALVSVCWSVCARKALVKRTGLNQRLRRLLSTATKGNFAWNRYFSGICYSFLFNRIYLFTIFLLLLLLLLFASAVAFCFCFCFCFCFLLLLLRSAFAFASALAFAPASASFFPAAFALVPASAFAIANRQLEALQVPLQVASFVYCAFLL